MQVDAVKYPSLGKGFKVSFKGRHNGNNNKIAQVTIAEGGVGGLARGWAPTAIGYSMQGACKFGFYELFKNVYGNAIGEEAAYQNQVALYLAASASAEFFADIALCPMEAVKVRFNHYVTDFYVTHSGQNPDLKLCFNPS